MLMLASCDTRNKQGHQLVLVTATGHRLQECFGLWKVWPSGTTGTTKILHEVISPVSVPSPSNKQNKTHPITPDMGLTENSAPLNPAVNHHVSLSKKTAMCIPYINPHCLTRMCHDHPQNVWHTYYFLIDG